MSTVVNYARQKATVKRVLRKYGGGALCTLHQPGITVSDPDRPWDATTLPPVDYPDIPCVFFSTDFRYDMAIGYWPEYILPEAREVAYISAPDLPDDVDMREGWQLTKQDGTTVTILRSNLIRPDSVNKLLYIAQVSG